MRWVVTVTGGSIRTSLCGLSYTRKEEGTSYMWGWDVKDKI